MKNTGVEAEKAWEDRMSSTYIYRFPDQKALRGLNNNRPVGDFPKPADYLFLSMDAGLAYAEVKSVQSSTSFSFSGLRPMQMSTALQMAKRGRGHLYQIYIFSFGLGQWFQMSGTELEKRVSNGEKSVKFKELVKW
jgi:hypothetical protein